MTSPIRPLTGRIIGLSISECNDSERLGFPGWQVNRVTLQVVSAFFGQGASLVFGHDWREDGVMAAVYGFASQVQSPISAETEQPILRNVLPWPDHPLLEPADREQLSSTLQIERVPLPEELREATGEVLRDTSAPLYRYARARGLTSLRKKLNDMCNARICLGGQRVQSEGRYPGVVEEALFALRSGKPLFVGAVLGGAARQVTEAVEGKQMPEDFCFRNEVSNLYFDPPVREVSESTLADRVVDPVAVWNEFRNSMDRIVGTNGLKVEENLELFQTRSLDRLIELVMIGLSRLNQVA